MTALSKDQMNHHENVGAEYPRMLYRATAEEKRQEQTDKLARCGETYLIVNSFNGLLCDTVVAESPDDAETLAADGWETSPEAAYGMKPGLGAATSAKDERIAELEAMLAAKTHEDQGTAYDSGAVGHEAVGRRGPGRPRKVESPASALE